MSAAQNQPRVLPCIATHHVLTLPRRHPIVAGKVFPRSPSSTPIFVNISCLRPWRGVFPQNNKFIAKIARAFFRFCFSFFFLQSLRKTRKHTRERRERCCRLQQFRSIGERGELTGTQCRVARVHCAGSLIEFYIPSQ
uniref:(northern house mosquito) hypothetical protein n=1 Tax=Culex pipiens TaxID=7175 RepID=A0A8D8F2T5_CULPI